MNTMDGLLNKLSAKIILSWAIAFTFIYAAVDGFINPEGWIGYFPGFLRAIVPGNILLPVFGIFQCLLGVWLILGWKRTWSAGLAFLTLLGITVFNLGVFEVTFRDVGLALAALALFDLARREEAGRTKTLNST